MQKNYSFLIINLQPCRLQIPDFKIVESLAEKINKPIAYLKSNLFMSIMDKLKRHVLAAWKQTYKINLSLKKECFII